MLKVGVMVSGGGTNLQAIIDGVHSGVITNAKLEVVISNKKDAYALTVRLGFRAEDGTERLGSPVLFGSSYFGALCSLPEGKGGGVVIRRHPESVQAVYAARQEELEDADTVEELERLRKLL